MMRYGKWAGLSAVHNTAPGRALLINSITLSSCSSWLNPQASPFGQNPHTPKDIYSKDLLVMELTITFFTGKSFPLTAPLHTTVRQLKSMIQECEQVPSAKQRLSTQNGHRIDLKDDSRTLQDYETVAQFKQKVQNKEGVPIQQQLLKYESKPLEDGRKLEDYGIKAGSTINLLLRVRGG
ncbi:hypothetical protein COCON_G00161330 [Conger conger]|uniref:Ubiquitin-like domain-containing protein n=1 Tax=Conger conger TaxID=82655 RepID=A0A9Q1DA93_CONCO|nr:hypothetical protein COCON_G00161330 [Conger conger]